MGRRGYARTDERHVRHRRVGQPSSTTRPRSGPAGREAALLAASGRPFHVRQRTPRALRILPEVKLRIDPAAAASLLHWSFVPHPGTIYEGVHQLPPGGLLKVSISDAAVTVAERSWWSLGDTLDRAIDDRSTLTLDEAAEQLETLLADAVAVRMESDVPLGAFLSGGIDSSLISALARRAQPGGTLRTFTVSMPELGFESRAMRRPLHGISVPITKRSTLRSPMQSTSSDDCRPSGTSRSLTPRCFRPRCCVRLLAGICPCVSAATAAMSCSLDTTAMCSAGVHFSPGYSPPCCRAESDGRRHARAVTPHDRQGIARRVSRAPGIPTVPNAGDKVQKVAALLRADGRSWDTLAQIWPSSDLGPTPAGPSVPHLTGRIDEVEQLMLADTSAVLPDQMLVKVDRASMAASLEVRAPFLDHRLLEWSWRQPTQIKTAGGVGKVVLRRVAERVLPAEIVERPKMGFDPPLGAWLRNELRPWANDLLASAAVGERGVDRR